MALTSVCLQVPPASGAVQLATQSFVDGAHALGKRVHMFVINEPQHMRTLAALGIDAIMTGVWFSDSVLMTAIGWTFFLITSN